MGHNCKRISANGRASAILLPRYDRASSDHALAARYDYFDRKVTPFMNELRMKGIFADHMRNVFVTKTFPNHHTISTGMYVENHGVIDSEYLDVKSNKTVKYSYDLYHYNNDVLPIWTLNELNGGERRSGVMMWPGSAFEYHKKNATFRVVSID
ncbi:unnamed protein product [Trichogramma brassicae]|uniref:Uncharacterized protein n=1 Tax=Trichogramma brassicae TaxID=86971 RepID=A0A6H5J442_9HYME|nr:unnamed protein product [Trichogramma brassicae]